jgi:hypothetical protein
VGGKLSHTTDERAGEDGNEDVTHVRLRVGFDFEAT